MSGQLIELDVFFIVLSLSLSVFILGQISLFMDVKIDLNLKDTILDKKVGSQTFQLMAK